MKLTIFLPITVFIVSCSSINVERKSSLSFDTLFIAQVEMREVITLEANESKAGRVLVGLLSAGIIGAIATANTEKGFSEPKAFKYNLLSNNGETKIVISRSIADNGSCVEVISPDESEIELLIAIPSEKCTNSYNNAPKEGTPQNGAP